MSDLYALTVLILSYVFTVAFITKVKVVVKLFVISFGVSDSLLVVIVFVVVFFFFL